MNGIHESQKSESVQVASPLIGIKKERKHKNNFYVYVLLDTRKPGEYIYGDYEFDHEPIYVGKGKNDRAKESRRTHNKFLQRKIKKIGKPIILFLNKGLIEDKAFTKEREVIASIGRLIKKEGPLLNITDGGGGASGRCVPHTEETKRKISESKMGHPVSEETRKLLSEQRKGVKTTPCSEEKKKKISEAQIGKIVSLETRRNMSLGHIGKPSNRKGAHLTQEQKDHLSRINKGKTLSEETILKMSRAMKGRVFSVMEKINISNGVKRNWEERRIKYGTNNMDTN